MGVSVDKPGMTVVPRTRCDTVTANLSRSGGGPVHVRRKPGGTRLVFVGRSSVAAALGLCLLGAWTALAVSLTTTALGAPQTENAPRIFHKARNFRIPFNLNPEGKERVKELNLLVSEDSGYHWRAISKTFPDHPTFTFRSTHDGEYWFAVQTRTVDGRVSPSLESTIEPNLKVVVDTFPPALVLEPDERRGSLATVRWEVKDENLNPKSLVLEYQVEGATSWRRVPIGTAKLMGSRRWDAGTAEALKVRASVSDRAGNVTEAFIDLPEGTGSPPDLSSAPPGFEDPPGISQIPGGGGSDITAGPGFTPVSESPPSSRGSGSGPPRQSRGSRARPAADNSRRPRTAAQANWDSDSSPAGPARSERGGSDRPSEDLFVAAGGGGGFGAPGGSPATGSLEGAKSNAAPGARNPGETLLVASPKFKLQYAVEDGGPSGPATVELWITHDGGRNWIRRGGDDDRVSPVEVDLGGEGTFGLCLVARSASGLGDQPPAPGDPPQSWVEVDSTAPVVQIQPPQIGTGVNAGKVAIAWKASDLHLPSRSVTLSWRPDQPGAQWQTIADALENSGQFIWNVPPAISERFHLKVEATDSVGHHGSADTTESGAIAVDRSRPRSRIIGLDPNAHSGIIGAETRPMR
jgi:hypothetical protein